MAEGISVLIVDDEAAIRRIFSNELKSYGFQVAAVGDVPAAREHLRESTPDAIVLDVRLPGVTGDVFLRELREAGNLTPVIIMTGHANVELAVSCMKSGASDLVTKPCSLEQLSMAITRAVESQRLREANAVLSRYSRPARAIGRLIGSSARMQAVHRLIERVGPTDEPILVHGESGTGKELIAAELQSLSRRASRPFLTINCAAVTETLLESELFGHEKGAFSGAAERRLGFFELADGGTLFLDEIGDMPLAMQAKLLRVLQSGEFRRVGGARTLTADARIITATNKHLPDEVRAGRFREDLFHRINTITIEVPPLRDHPEDLEELVAAFLEEVRRSGRAAGEIAPDALAALRAYQWPGNVRELRNAIRRAAILADSGCIERDSLPPQIAALEPAGPPAATEAADGDVLSLEDVERRHIMHVLRLCGGNKTQAARRLGVSVKTLYNKFEAWGISSADE